MESASIRNFHDNKHIFIHNNDRGYFLKVNGGMTKIRDLGPKMKDMKISDPRFGDQLKGDIEKELDENRDEIHKLRKFLKT